MIDKIDCAQCEVWRKEYNVACANGYISRAIQIGRRMKAHARSH